MKKKRTAQEHSAKADREATPDGAPVEGAAAAASAATAAPPEETADMQALKDRLLRLQADFDNYRKRTLRERNDVYRRANEDLMQELLPVMDHLEMGLRTAREQGVQEGVCHGFQLVYEQLQAALTRFGLSPVDAEGEPFDPNLHEAISVAPSADVPRDRVLVQTRRGYRLGDLLLRPAQVVLSGGPAEEEADAAEAVPADAGESSPETDA